MLRYTLRSGAASARERIKSQAIQTAGLSKRHDMYV
jgi:hypothetical protein